MNGYRRFKHGRSYWRNARFGAYPHFGAHRFVYYMDGRPLYYFSDRPYTIGDAKIWKTRNLFCFGTLSVCTLLFLLDSDMHSFNPEMLLIFVGVLCIAAFSIFRTIVILGLHPEDDPMLRSFQCTGGLEKPSEETCAYCGGIYARGVHTACPHCNAPIK